MTVKAPNFKLISTSNEVVELNKIKSKLIVLYFYPKDDTPGCTLETKDFNSLINKFSKNETSQNRPFQKKRRSFLKKKAGSPRLVIMMILW